MDELLQLTLLKKKTYFSMQFYFILKTINNAVKTSVSIVFCKILLNNFEKISFFKHSKISQENFKHTANKIMNHHIKLVQEPVYSSTRQQTKW